MRDIIAHRIELQIPHHTTKQRGNYVHVLHLARNTGKSREYEGELDAEVYPGLDLDNGPAIINHLVQQLNQEKGDTHNWEECDLTDSFFNREDTYVNFNGRWMRRSDTPWRKDRNN